MLFVAFVIAPLVYGLWISLHDYDYTLPDKPFVGLDNYTGLLDGTSPFADPFWNSMQATWHLHARSRCRCCWCCRCSWRW